VTGGTGSLGQRLVRHLLDTRDPAKVVVYSRDEFKQVEMARTFADPRVRYIVGDVRNTASIARALRGVDFCIHTAALKHVDKAEYGPAEYIDVNVNGTLSVVEACDRAGVARMVFVSTDKAVMPINLYGATKLCAEKAVLAACAQNRNIYTVVRYGNVLESRGSALQFFRDAVNHGAEALPVTDEAMTRFAMSFEMALRLIDVALNGPPQVVYVAKAKSFRLLDLTYALDRPIVRMGLRPGEKMHETLVSRYESLRASDWGDHIRIAPEKPANTDVDYSGGDPVPPAWEYTSGTTRNRLTVEELKEWP
jgi:UDP-N-acetylglucosamine 4,6-dehydratase